jgi:hypothetical protein
MTELLMTHRIPASTTPLGDWLAEVADRVTLITSTEAFAGYQDAFPNVYAVPDYSTNSAIEVLLAETCRRRPVRTLIHVTEDDVLRCARIRDRFGIAGLRPPEALAWRDKHLMKYLVRGRVPVADFTAPASAAAAAEFAATTGFPIVAKPRTGFSSHGVAVAGDRSELLRLVAERDRDDVLLESFVAGEMLHIDGFTQAGECLFAVPSIYVNGCLAFQDGRPLGSRQLDPGSAEFRRAIAFAERVLAAMPPVDFCPFHLEAFQRPDGELVFCEIACRLGGAHIMEALTYATGVNPARLWIRHQAGLEDGPAVARTLTPGDRRYGWLLIPPRRGRLVAIDQAPPLEFIADFIVKSPVPRRFTGASGSTDSYLAFVVSGPDSTALDANLRKCADLADDLTTWEQADEAA